MIQVEKIEACLVPFDRGRFHQLLKLGLYLIPKFLSNIPAEILLAEVDTAAQSALACHQLHKFAAERRRGAKHDITAVQETGMHVLSSGAQTREAAPLLAQDLQVAARHFSERLQTSGLNNEMSGHGGADEGAQIRGNCSRPRLDEQKKFLARILDLKHGVCGALHGLQLLAAQRLAHSGCGGNGDHHNLCARKNIVKLHGGEVIVVADALHHASVIERV
jgi:hypothetical protein